jgi:D-alanyl-D-alanine carboxypeptidase (penicillin-binding protein 5/6)
VAAGFCAVLGLVLALPAPAQAVPVAPLQPIDGLAVDPPPDLEAVTWILYDDTYDIVLAAEDADVERPMASTTKIMTGIVAFENSTPGQTVVVSQYATDVGEAEVPLEPGEALPIDALTTGLMVRSANDAAISVAEGIAGSEAAFVGMMNARADELGLRHTHFENPHGLDAPGHYTSARDLLDMGLAGMEIPEFREAVATKVDRFPPAPDGTTRAVQNTNMMLWDYEGAFGVKTGYTLQAGLTLVAGAERENRRLYAVVMGSTSERGHFADATKLLDYGFESFGVVPLVIEGDVYGLRRSADGTDPLRAAASLEAFVHIAGAGLLSPRLDIVDGEAMFVVGEEGFEVPVEGDEAPLPTGAEAFSWFTHWFETAS